LRPAAAYRRLGPAVRCGADERRRLALPSQTIIRPDLLNEGTHINNAGQVVLRVKMLWRDGTPANGDVTHRPHAAARDADSTVSLPNDSFTADNRQDWMTAGGRSRAFGATT
jgi:hypothetical protein